ncbi:MAG TPA: Gfo/Idh/MocA family oxidoreductase [Gemmatimonadales bacterium]
MTAPLRLVALGCGRVFERFHLPALRSSPDWTLVAAVDPSADRVRWVQRMVPNVAVVGALSELDSGLAADAVLVSAPPDTHCALAAEALRRGAHVLLEKPMALGLPEAASLLALAGDVGRQIWVGYNRRFRPAFRRLRAHLAEVPPDEVRRISYELRSSPAQWGALSGWLSLQERGGGLLDDIASHQLDLVPWIVARPVEAVRARFLRRDDREIVVAMDLRFAGGLQARCTAAHGPHAAERLEVRLARRSLIATQGAMIATTLTPGPLADAYLAGRTAIGSAMRRLRRAPGHTLDSFSRQLAAWAGALRGGTGTGAADGAAGARCVALVEACRQSLAVGGEWIPAPATEGVR